MSLVRYRLDDIPIREMILVLARVSETMADFHRKLACSPVQKLFAQRMQFFDVVSSCAIDGSEVSMEDLVRVDAAAFSGPITLELKHAHRILETRRTIASLLNHGSQSTGNAHSLTVSPNGLDIIVQIANRLGRDKNGAVDQPAIFRADHEMAPRSQEDSWPSMQPLDEWFSITRNSDIFPPALRAAILVDSFNQLKILGEFTWLGRQAAGLFPRICGLCADPIPLNIGLKGVSSNRYNSADRDGRLVAILQVFERVAKLTLKEHDQIMTAKKRVEPNALGRRRNSKLPDLLELSIARPLVSAETVSNELGVTTVGARNLIRDLGLAETTGRGRDRFWRLK